MTTLEDDKLYEYAHRLQGAVVLITGGANGIGKTASIDFAKQGCAISFSCISHTYAITISRAKVVIGDLDESSGKITVAEIIAAGGQAIFRKTDVLEYESLVALFQNTIDTYGRVDVVVPCAGVTENTESTVGVIILDKNGVPKRPGLKTVEVNLLAVMTSENMPYNN